MRILYVCTANICRSASAEQLLRGAIAGAPQLVGVEVRSAGTAAMVGSPGCSIAPAMQGHAGDHRSQPLTAELVAWADLILPAARDHRSAIVDLDPRSRARTFTVRQAGRIADWLVDSGMIAAGRERAAIDGPVGAGPGGDGAEAGPPVSPEADVRAQPHGEWADRFPPDDPRRDVPALPADLDQRWAWLVDEMDAARGRAAAPVAADAGLVGAQPARRRWIRRGQSQGGGGAAPGGVPGGAAAGVARSGAGGAPGGAPPAGGARSVDPSALHPDDVPDPHVLGSGLHPLAYEQIAASTAALVRLLGEVAAEG